MGKWIQQLKQRNEGSTLVLVLLCMTFLGLLGSVVLTATVSNMRMKTVDSLSKENFYTTESAVDELKVGIEETAEVCMKEAYSYMLQRYAATPESERTVLLKRKFVNLLYNNLATIPSSNAKVEDSPVNIMVLNDYLVSTTGKKATIVSGSGLTVVKNLNDMTVTLKGVSISYTDTAGYQSTITTDIKIKALYPTLSTRKINNNMKFLDYALIADGLIYKQLGDVIVTGNVYGGAGIHANDSDTTLTLNSNKVISRKGLVAMDKAKIYIPGQMKDSSLLNSVWVKNIATSGGNGAKEGKDYIDITANCYVADDLTLGANFGNVKIAGNYYGYQTNNVSIENPCGTASGSSISINARHAELNLEGIKDLWISGNAYLSIPELYGGDDIKTTSGIQPLTGESISFKGNQVAYLVPGNCITGIGHNPMTHDEYKKLEDGTDGCEVEISDSTLSGDIELSKYVNSLAPYSVHNVKYLNSDDSMLMVYLYWNFQSVERANEYFEEYWSKNENADKLKSIADTFGLGAVKLPKDENARVRVSEGTIFSYDPDLTINKLKFANGGKLYQNQYDTDIDVEELDTLETNYTGKYYGLANSLIEDSNELVLNPSLVENLVHIAKKQGDTISGLEEDAEAKYNKKHSKLVYSEGIDEDTTGAYVLVTGEDVQLSSTDTGNKGLIITSGDVVINDCNFTGLIIAKGNITFTGRAEINADYAYVKNIIETTPEVSKYIYDFVGSTVKENGDKSTIDITYENWFKE